eukprot:364786-Chlamydomonas_euryale.AAC.18
MNNKPRRDPERSISSFGRPMSTSFLDGLTSTNTRKQRTTSRPWRLPFSPRQVKPLDGATDGQQPGQPQAVLPCWFRSPMCKFRRTRLRSGLHFPGGQTGEIIVAVNGDRCIEHICAWSRS